MTKAGIVEMVMTSGMRDYTKMVNSLNRKGQA